MNGEGSITLLSLERLNMKMKSMNKAVNGTLQCMGFEEQAIETAQCTSNAESGSEDEGFIASHYPFYATYVYSHPSSPCGTNR